MPPERRVAAGDVAARQAHPQVDPAQSFFDTASAHRRCGDHRLRPVEIEGGTRLGRGGEQWIALARVDLVEAGVEQGFLDVEQPPELASRSSSSRPADRRRWIAARSAVSISNRRRGDAARGLVAAEPAEALHDELARSSDRSRRRLTSSGGTPSDSSSRRASPARVASARRPPRRARLGRGSGPRTRRRRAKEALEVAEHHVGDIDLLLSDITMPEMGGQELADKLTKKQPAIKVILMSAVSRLHLVLQRGWKFLQKPFKPADVKKTIEEVL